VIEHGHDAVQQAGALDSPLQQSPGRLPNTRRRFPLARPVLAVSLAAGLTATMATAGAAAASTASRRPASAGLATVSVAPRLPFGARVLGGVPANTQVTAEIALKLPHPGAVTSFISQVTNPRSPLFHHYLARGQFAKIYGPSAATIASVKSVLGSDGLAVTKVSQNGILVTFRGTAAKVEAAFHTGLVRVRLADGTIGRATTSRVELPASVARSVTGLVGLNELFKPQNTLEKMRRYNLYPTHTGTIPRTSNGPVACPAAAAVEATGGLTDQQVAASYGLDNLYNANDTASGQTIDIYELEPFNPADLIGFDSCYFGPSHIPSDNVIQVDGGPGSGLGGGEAALDVEDVSAVAPSATINVYSGPPSSLGYIDTWNAMAVADDAGQISSSWYSACETTIQQSAPGLQQVESEIFSQNATQGQTVLEASGDDGVDTCANHGSSPVAAVLSQSDPASQPYVTAVGGTTMTDAANPPLETVWNNGNDGGGGGGGVSETWAMPSWQSKLAANQTPVNQGCSNDSSGTPNNYNVGVPTNLTAGTLCREVPDVSALADPQTGITIEYGGQWFQIGGTSSATPLWAAMLAEIASSSACNGLPNGDLGFVSPLLYQIAETSATSYANAFNDIKQGNNDNLSVGGGIFWPAGTGFDMASGLGTPRVTDGTTAKSGLSAELCALALNTATPNRPTITSLSSNSGGRAGGGTLVINGNNFGPNTSEGKVFFGNVQATVSQTSDWTNTAITVQIPAYEPPPNTPSGSGGGAPITVVTGGGVPESSSPSSVSLYHYESSASGGPIVDYVSSASGPTAGGNDVWIVGSGLTDATGVTFGDQSGFIVTNPGNNDNELEVQVPASDGHCAVAASSQGGMCAVKVTVNVGTAASSGPSILPAYQGAVTFGANGVFVPPSGCGCEVVQQPEEYDYAPVPHISKIAPSYVSEAGFSPFQITGTGFNYLSLYYVNVGPAAENTSIDFSLTSITSTEIDELAPPGQPTHNPLGVNVTVVSGGGTSNIVNLNYAGVPAVGSLSKHVAAQANPGSLTINPVAGTNFLDATSVQFIGQGSLNFVSSTTTNFAIEPLGSQIIVNPIPQMFTVPMDVEVCTVTGCSVPNPSVDNFLLAYAGQPVIEAASIPAHGGNFTFNGQLDSDITAVHFGTALVPVVSQPFFTSSGPVTVLAPTCTAGTPVTVTITTVGGSLVGKPTSNPVKFPCVASTPAAPLSVAAVAGKASATVTWKAPSNNGGSAITAYLITGTAPKKTPVSKTVSATTLKAAFTGLASKVPWTFTVLAENKLGKGLAASAKPVTPS
jgi:hypothetical protein